MDAELPVVHLKIRHRATGLTPPAITTQDLLTQTFLRQGVQPRGSGLLGESFSGGLLSKVFEKSLLLFAGQELVVTGNRVEQDLRVAIVQVRASQEVGADHLQTVTARLDRKSTRLNSSHANIS